jgi:hypothetical protein
MTCARRISILWAVLAAGCSSGTGSSSALCARTEPPIPLAVSCIVPDIVPPTAPVRVSGVVQEWGTGFDGCLTRLQDYASMNGVPASAFHLLRIRTAAQTEQSFGLLLPGVNVSLAAGDAVEATYEIRGGGFAPAISRLELRTSAGLLFYLGQGGRPDEMTAPAGVSIALGAELCSTNTCGPWSRYDLAIAIGGTMMQLQPGSRAQIAPYQVVVGESAQQTGGSMCADWFVSHTTVVIAR